MSSKNKVCKIEGNVPKCVYVEEELAVSCMFFWINFNLHLYSVECIPVVSYKRQSIADSWYLNEQPCVLE